MIDVMDNIEKIILLQRLKASLAYFKYAELNLQGLEPLRFELQTKIDRIIAEDKGKKDV